MFAGIELHPRLEKGLEKQSISEPTEVQLEVIPEVLNGKDLQVCAETGSGKTLAYLLPIMQKMLTHESPDSATRALVLVPTRELARQVFKEARKLTDFTQLDVGVLTGGEEFKFQAAVLRKNPEILIATPGRLVDHLRRNTAELGDLEFLILDEADRMLDMGFSEDMERIIFKCGTERQSMMLSATLRHEGVGRVARSWLKDPIEITTQRIQDQHGSIRQQRILADDNAHKDRLLAWLLSNETFEKAIIFTNTRAEVQRLSEFLRRHRNGVAMLHGEMTQDERNYVMQGLRDGRRDVLIATDVAGRGLDVEGMDLVINYDLARKGDEYIHRIGRTGRAGREGLAISLIGPREWNLKAAIERYIQQEMEPRTIQSLKAKYTGPKKLKASGKAAGPKKKKGKDLKKALGKKGASLKKKSGPRPSKPASSLMDKEGFAPIKRKKQTD